MTYELCSPFLRTSGSLVGNFVTSWTLPNFFRISLIDQPERKFSSGVISRGEEISWQIHLYPHGKVVSINDSKEYVSCLVAIFPTGSRQSGNSLKVRSAISFRTSSGETLCRSAHSEWSVPGKLGNFDVKDLMERNVLLEKIPDNILVVCVEMSFSKSTVMTESESLDLGEVSPLAVLTDDISSLYITGRHGDLVFNVEGKHIRAHQTILAARSRVFAAMFEHDLSESRSRTIEMSDFDEKSVRSMLQFIYSGTVDEIDASLALELLRASEKYDLQDLKSYCSVYLIAEMNHRNVMEVLIAADVFNASLLRAKSIEYFCNNKSAIDFQSYRAVLQEYPNILVDIITNTPQC